MGTLKKFTSLGLAGVGSVQLHSLHHSGVYCFVEMYHFYQFNRQTFLAHYHKRSNVESTFSMIKMKFGGAIRAKPPVAQTNEVLCKVLAHNICVLIASMYELGIEPTFRSEMALDRKAE